MEVIFIKELRGQGKKGELKKVKDGYGENFLIKKGYAVLKTSESLAKLKKEQKEKENIKEQNMQEAKELKEKIEKRTKRKRESKRTRYARS